MLVNDHRTLWGLGLEKLIEAERPRMEVAATAANAAQAIALAGKTRPDVILLDIDRDEESSIAGIPPLVAGSSAKVLAITGLRDPEVHDSAVLAGARGVVQKEDATTLILKAIERVHEGEVWLDRAATGRILGELARKNGHAPSAEGDGSGTLTARERQIIGVISEHAGASTKAVAEMLRISEHTVRNHLTSIYAKLGLLNRLQLFVYASKHGLTQRTA
jgi:two-component system, NarL family, nitrate/nitrite response regulator NarL